MLRTAEASYQNNSCYQTGLSGPINGLKVNERGRGGNGGDGILILIKNWIIV